MWEDVLKQLFRRLGLEVSHYRPAAPRRAELMKRLGVKTVLDVGANAGQYAQQLRRHGYDGAIVSFEPIPRVFDEAMVASRRDSRWNCVRVALGDFDGEAPLSLASNTASSSLLEMLDTHRQAAPNVDVVGTEVIEVRRLDSLNLSLEEPVMLKLDVQGYEDRVLRGATTSLDRVVLVECELSVVPLYDSQLSIRHMLDLFAVHGFELAELEVAFRDRRGRVVQLDGLFVREGT